LIISSFQIIYGDDNFIIGKKERRGEKRRGEEAKKSSSCLPKQIEQHELDKTNRAAAAAKHRGEDKKQSGDDRIMSAIQ